MKKRTLVDIAMTAALPLLMAYSLVGETLHEWIGASMFLLFILHHVLNRKWFSGLRRGTYTLARRLNTAVSLLLLLVMLLMMASALMISRHVFAFLGIGGASIGRVIHLAGANWGFLLMSLHLGLHGNALAGRFGLGKGGKTGSILRIFFLTIAAYGLWASVKRGLWSYLFFTKFYAEFDHSEPVICFLLDYLAIMILFAVIGFYGAKALAYLDRRKAERERGAVLEDPEEEAKRQRLLQEKKKKNRLVRRLVLAGVILIAGLLWGIPYMRRHYSTVWIDQEQAAVEEQVDLGRTLIVCFTRVGNTDFEPDVDAVSSASLMLNRLGQLVGNAQLLAKIAANATGGELYEIRVKNHYPSSYGDTVSAAGEELRAEGLPELDLKDGLPDIEDHDRIILVFPLWWSTVPKPVEAYLAQYDWSGRGVDLILTHGGGGKGNVPHDLAAMLSGGTLNENILLVYDDDADEAAPQVCDWLKSIK